MLLHCGHLTDAEYSKTHWLDETSPLVSVVSLFLTELKYTLRSFWRRHSKSVRQIVLAEVIAIAAMVTGSSHQGIVFDQWVLRQFFEFRGARLPPPDLLIIAIDDLSYQALGASMNFPLPRRYIASALERLVSASPRLLVLDAAIPAEPTLDPESDRRIESAIKRLPTTIWSGEMPSGSGAGTSGVILRSDERFRAAARLELPMTVFGSGGVVSYISSNQSPYAPLFERVPITKALIALGKMNVAAPGPNDLINFYGAAGTIPRVSVSELLSDDSKALRPQIAGKILLMGYQSLARGRGTMEKDEFPVTVSPHPMFGLEIHASVVGNLIDHSWLFRLKLADERLLLLLASFIVACAGLRARPRKALPLIGLVMIAITSGGYWQFSRNFFWFGGIGMLLVSCLVTILISALHHVAWTDRFRKYLEKTLPIKFNPDL